MKKSIIIFLLALTVGAAKAQTSAYMPDCDTSKTAVFTILPCKVPVVKNHKVVGYTEKSGNIFYSSTAEFLKADGNSSLYIGFQTLNVSYPVSFHYGNKISFWTSYPNQETGEVTLHIKRKELHWLNDSTAVYIPSKTEIKTKRKWSSITSGIQHYKGKSGIVMDGIPVYKNHHKYEILN